VVGGLEFGVGTAMCMETRSASSRVEVIVICNYNTNSNWLLFVIGA